jgi:hypothetical protein
MAVLTARRAIPAPPIITACPIESRAQLARQTDPPFGTVEEGLRCWRRGRCAAVYSQIR